jgi:hypothetical protein
MRLISGLLVLSSIGSGYAAAQSSEPAKVSAYLKTLPAVPPPPFDEAKREMLATSAILCSDHLQEPPPNRNNYLWQYRMTPQLLDQYLTVRSFYGCGNWHDAVASEWMMMSTLNQDPKISLNTTIKDIATTHFKKTNTDGEMAFFNAERPVPGGMNFERPYGYAWLIKLYGEAKGGNTADDRKMAVALAPMARWMSERLVYYFYNLKFPFRSGVETNTAWTMSLILDGANLAEDDTLKRAVHDNALRLFSGDKRCAANFEPQNSDLISSCLSEAALMGRVMPQPEYLKWLDAFLPPVYSDAFQVYAKPIDISHASMSGPDAQVQQLAEARLVSLEFQRAVGLLTIAYALPKDDARIAVLRNLAAQNAKWAYEKYGVGGYEGQHFMGTYALLYENEVKGPALLAPPPKPKRPGVDDSAESLTGN